MDKEELAEEYLKDDSKWLIEDNEGNLINITKKVKQAFLAGLKAKTYWHKVADGDLPKNASTVIIAYYAVDEKSFGIKELKRTKEIVTEQCFYLENQGWTDTSDGEPYPYLNKDGSVIAWCELPKFEELL